MSSSLKNSFNEALAHLMIAKGSVAKSIDPTLPDYRQERFGSYYGSDIEADPLATFKFWERLTNGAKVLYEDCGPSDFGQETRFNGTFSSSELRVHYATFPVVLDDDPTNPITLVAGMSELYNSFIKTLELLSTIGSFEEALACLEKRIDYHCEMKSYCEHHRCYCSLGIPRLA